MRIAFVIGVLLLAQAHGGSALGQGIFLTGVGAVNRSMGGAATAAPIDAQGALHWNPGSISGLATNEMSIAAEIMLLDQQIFSVIPDVAGPGSDSAESGAAPIPAVGWVHHLHDSPWTIGLGMYSFAGFLQNMPVSTPTGTNNPILFAQPQGGFGPLFSEAQFFQIVPTASLALTDRLSVGLAPTITIGRLALDPNGFTTPLDDGTFPPGRSSRYHWGGGVQAGVYYIATENVHLGMSIKSPQWFEPFRFTTIAGDPADPTPTVTKAQIDLPLIASLGAAYSGFDGWVLAIDGRYWDYRNTDGFGRPGFSGGLAQSLGWSNVFSLALGVQRQVNDKLTVRGGYTFNTNPISSNDVLINIASPLHQQHVIGAGFSYALAPDVDVTLAYNQIIESSNAGPIAGAPPGSLVESTTGTYSVGLGVTVRYGCRGS